MTKVLPYSGGFVIEVTFFHIIDFRKYAVTLQEILSVANIYGKNLKLDSHLPKKICFIYFSESPLKAMKNLFYFILKALFDLKIFKI